MIFASGGHDGGHAILVTLVTAISAGVFLIALARKLDLPAIVLLLLGGVALGNEGARLAGFDSGFVQPDSLGDFLLIFVELAVGLILFEGGLTLEPKGYLSAPKMISRLLSLGVLITWLGTATALVLVLGVEKKMALIAASLVIVTGPTVIQPLLKRVQVPARVRSVLHWEGVLVDPIGVFIAVLCYEWVTQQSESAAFMGLLFRIGAGLLLGAIGGLGLTAIVRWQLVEKELLNISAIGWAVLIFGLSESIISKSGLLSITLTGFVFGFMKPAGVKQIKEFKAEITDLLIGMLFILLASRLKLNQFAEFGMMGAASVAVVMFVVRPIVIMVCSSGLGFKANEKAFLSWVAPRGIVAASLSSLFALNLAESGMENPRFVETFTYSVIVATIILQGLTAAPIARLLKLRPPERTGWLIVGAHAFGRRIARFLKNQGERDVILLDSNAGTVRQAVAENLDARMQDARDTTITDGRGFETIGHLLALTDNDDLNVRLCRIWKDVFGHDKVFRYEPATPAGGHSLDEEDTPGHSIWNELGKPSVISAEIDSGMTDIQLFPGDQAPRHSSTILAQIKDEKLEMGVEEPSVEKDTRTLHLVRRGNYLAHSFDEQLILTVVATDIRALFGKIIDRIVDVYPSLDKEKTLEELVERESAFPTTLGQGVAIPHVYSSTLKRRICAVARVPNGIHFTADTDREPIKLVFLLISPNGDPEGHLATLSEIARTLGREGMIESVMEAETDHDVLKALKSKPSPGK